MAKRVIVTGGTGFIGRALCRRLVEKDYEVVVLSRNASHVKEILGETVRGVRWDGRSADGWSEYAEGAYGIVNLAGANIAAGRWTAGLKTRILESRLDAGRAVTGAVARASKKPRVLVQASATGYYGNRGEEVLTESSTGGTGFLADVAHHWERSTENVVAHGVRRVVVRTAVVVGRDGGLLGRILPPFQAFLGGPMGSGRQWFPWIHLADEVEAICFLLEHEDLHGPFNLAAPQQLRSRGFYGALGHAIGRPSWLRMPGSVLRLVLGEMADELILVSQKVIPERLLKNGFSFRFTEIGDAFGEIFGGVSR
ncbi:MAG: TIGR01777 family oxidoreductase [bacterium]|nr:MAG: TIGR01777 family oxidoreductase [bacterium]